MAWFERKAGAWLERIAQKKKSLAPKPYYRLRLCGRDLTNRELALNFLYAVAIFYIITVATAICHLDSGLGEHCVGTARSALIAFVLFFFLVRIEFHRYFSKHNA
jgi:hypothetical protein